VTDEAKGVKLTKSQRSALRFILDNGPGTMSLASGRTPAAVDQLVQAGMLETLNRLRPGSPMYEITPVGRQALSQEGEGK
jgi:hypothetical protein